MPEATRGVRGGSGMDASPNSWSVVSALGAVPTTPSGEAGAS